MTYIKGKWEEYGRENSDFNVREIYLSIPFNKNMCEFRSLQ